LGKNEAKKKSYLGESETSPRRFVTISRKREGGTGKRKKRKEPKSLNIGNVKFDNSGKAAFGGRVGNACFQLSKRRK